MMQRRGLRKEFSRTPSLPKSEPPVNDPPYEVIEFPSQQYSNTSAVFGNKTEPKKEEPTRKCDLCGSSNAQYYCESCAQQAFCVSCDQMYHRHPKRQTHIRRRLPNVSLGKIASQPPIPPKGELSSAPIPPPRRNKRASKTASGFGQQQETFKKNGSIMGSLKRFVGGIQPTSSFQPKGTRNDSRPSKFSHNLHSAEFDQQSLRRDAGYLDWELNNRHRSGSFAALNGPGFSPMMQAQSMAQLNCPSCHHHGMSAWDWNRSQMNLNAFQQPWPGMSTGTWNGSVMFQPPYRMAENFSDHSSRRGSIRHQRYNRRPSKFDNEDDSESDISLSDDRKSRRRSPPSSMRGASPALSRRSRRTMASDTEDDTISRKSDRRFKRRTVPATRDPSPAVFRRNIRKKFDDDDAVSMKSTSSRKSLKSPVNRKPLSSALLRKNIHSSSDSDDELTSERDANGDKNTSADDIDEKPTKPITKVSDVTKAAANQKTRVAEKIKNYEKMQVNTTETESPSVKNEKSQDTDDWECEHCTYLNSGSSRVCDVCCKSKKSEKSNNEEVLVESMKNLKVSPADGGEKKKGDQSNNGNTPAKTSTGTSPPPQSAATQTYDVPSMVTKRNRSLSFEDCSDWNPNKKSSSAASFTSDNQSLPAKQEQSKSQSPEYSSVLLQKQLKDGLEIVKLLQDAEKHQFNPDDLTVALMHCGETNPIKWLLENWTKMIDTVVTLATNYGHEQPENIIGTISSMEAKAALHLHNGDVWAAATECIRQRQRKYVKLISQGNFTREDVVTVLTANHGDLEAAYMELRKSQLKPFLMKIWGPPQGLDNDSGNTFRFQDREKYFNRPNENEQLLPKISKYHPSCNNFNAVQSWLKSVHPSYQEDIELVDFMKLKNNLRQYASAFYLNNVEPMNSTGSIFSDLSNSNEELFSPEALNDPYLRYRSCENLNNTNSQPKPNTFKKRFHKSSESLFYNRTKPEYLNGSAKFFLHDLDTSVQNESRNDVEINIKNKLFGNDFARKTPEDDRYESDEYSDHEEIPIHSVELNNSDQVDIEVNESTNDFQNETNRKDSEEKDDRSIVETDSLNSADSVLHNSENDGETDQKDDLLPEAHVSNEIFKIRLEKNEDTDQKDDVLSEARIPNEIFKIRLERDEKSHQKDDVLPEANISNEMPGIRLEADVTPAVEVIIDELKKENVGDWENEKNHNLFTELKALYLLAKLNLEFFIISNNDASVEINDSSDLLQKIQTGFDHEFFSEHNVKPSMDGKEDNNLLSDDHLLINEFLPEKHNVDGSTFNNLSTDEEMKLSSDIMRPQIINMNSISEQNGPKNDQNFLIESSSGSESESEISESEDSSYYENYDKDPQSEFSLENESVSNDDASSEEESKYEESVNHEASVENIKEAFIDNIQHAIEMKNDTSDVIDQKEKIKPINFNPCIKPAHVIRITVPDDVVNASKKNYQLHEDINPSTIDATNITKIQTPAEKIQPKVQESVKIDQISKTEPINSPENQETGFHKRLPAKNDVNDLEKKSIDMENESIIKENKSSPRNSNQLDSEEEIQKSLPSSNEKESFSEYTREIIITEDTQSSVILKANEEEKFTDIEQSKQALHEEYLSDSSENSFKVEVQNCLSQGISNYDQAVLAAQLIQLKFDRSQSIDAALECSCIQTAITYLQQDCQLCAEKVSIKEMISMLECEHRCCQNCAEQFFSLQILEKSIVDCVCPFCKQPQISRLDSDGLSLYFSNLDILLKSILQPKVHELFQQKLRDRTLMQDPNFKWCIKCSSGFIAEEGQKRILCPDCNSVSCAQCGKLWDKEHDGRTCEQYSSWLTKNDPNSQLSRYLEDYGVTCPKCDTKFILVKGGCMHLTCSHCKYEFCSDCLKEFSMGTDCKVSDYCAKLGLHAHHPRNCLFYLRDKEPQELKQLLKDNNIQINLESSENTRCNVQLQKETEDGFVDIRCGARVEEAGLCRNHLREYLSRIICRLKLETIDVLTCDDLETIITREGIKRPPRGYSTPENEYYKALYQLVQEEMPIE